MSWKEAYATAFLFGMVMMLAISEVMRSILQVSSHTILRVNSDLAIVLLLLTSAFVYSMTKNSKIETIEPIWIFVMLGGTTGVVISITAFSL